MRKIGYYDWLRPIIANHVHAYIPAGSFGVIHLDIRAGRVGGCTDRRPLF